MNTAFIYLDTNILKFAAYRKMRLIPTLQHVRWGKIEDWVTVYSRVETDTRREIKDENLRVEIGYLRLISDAGKAGRARFFMNNETVLESWGLPGIWDTMDGDSFQPIEYAPAPVNYGRVIMGVGMDTKRAQQEFIASLPHPRLAQLKKWTGASQGKSTNRNQLLDAFHIWCAEYNGCTYFLTLDLKLIRSLTPHFSRIGTLPIQPSRLAKTLGLVHDDFDPTV